MNIIIKHKQQKGAVLPVVGAITLITVVAIILVWLLVWTKPQPQATLAPLPPVKVAVTEVDKRSVQPMEAQTGRLQPIKTAQLGFEVAGKVTRRQVEPGIKVDQDSVLMQLESSDYRNQFEQITAELEIEQESVARDKKLLQYARNNLDLQQQEVQRLQGLVTRNLIAQSQLDSVRQRVYDLQSEVARLEFTVATSHARLKMKKAQHDIAQRNLSRTTLYAAFEGVVNEVFVNVGDYVNANEVALTLVDASEYDVQLDVRGEIIRQLHLGQLVEVAIGEHKSMGKIVALQPDPDINTNTHGVRVRVSRENWQSGMLATVYLPLSELEQSLMIPVASVLNQYGKSYVFIVNNNNLVEKKPVKLGRRIDNQIVVRQGVVASQLIVARDVSSLADQQQVTIE